MTDLWLDIRPAGRALLRARGFSLLAVVILSIGIGASVMIFSVLNGVLLRPLPYSDPDRLVVAWEAMRAESGVRAGVSAAMFRSLREQERVFSGVTAYRGWGYELGGTDEPERLRGARVSANLFTLLGVRPLLGRTFVPDEDVPGAAPVVLLSEELWRRRFGGASVVGAALELNGQQHVVVGVMPSGFVLPEADIWVPLVFAPYELEQRGNRSFSAVARLQAGTRIEAARAAVRGLVERLEADFPEAHAGWDVALEDLHHDLAGSARVPLILLFIASCVVLLAACGNLASLVLARSVARRREIALRMALGAGRWRVVRQLVTENLLLVLVAGAAGLALAQAGQGGMVSLAANWLPQGVRIAIDPLVYGFVALITLMTGAALAVIPALETARLDPQQVIRATGATPRNRLGLRDATAVGQVALALVLLVGGGLLMRSFIHAQRVETGFVARNVVAMTMSLPARYGAPEQRASFFGTLETRVNALPSVRAAGLTSHLPMAGAPLVTDFEMEGRPLAGRSGPTAHVVNVTPGYFAALRIPIVAGRGFSADDRLGGPHVVVIDAELARRYWPGSDAVGHRIRMGATLGADTAWREVVGVAGAVRGLSIERAPEPTIYIPYAQNSWPSMSLVIDAQRAAHDVTQAAVAIVHDLDPTRPVYNVRPLQETMSRMLAPRRLQTVLMGGFAAAALALAILGVHGLLAHEVAQRSRELGVRMALGARRREIVWLCLRRGLTRVGAGLALGMTVALASSWLLAGAVFGVTPWDPTTFLGALVLLFIAGSISSAGPALRAARLDPLDAIRQE